LDRPTCGINPKKVGDVFRIRNQIIHELDMNTAGKKRKRYLRKQYDMVASADTLLGIAEALLAGVARASKPTASRGGAVEADGGEE